jgi:hypothetical protein
MLAGVGASLSAYWFTQKNYLGQVDGPFETFFALHYPDSGPSVVSRIISAVHRWLYSNPKDPSRQTSF